LRLIVKRAVQAANVEAEPHDLHRAADYSRAIVPANLRAETRKLRRLLFKR
jgi:hypothetical protein